MFPLYNGVFQKPLNLTFLSLISQYQVIISIRLLSNTLLELGTMDPLSWIQGKHCSSWLLVWLRDSASALSSLERASMMILTIGSKIFFGSMSPLTDMMSEASFWSFEQP